MSRADLTLKNLLGRSYEIFNLRPFTCCGMWVVYSLFQTNGSGGGNNEELDTLSPEMQQVIVQIALVWLIIAVFIGPPLKAGYQHAILRLHRGDNSVRFSDIFSGFDRYIKVFLASLLYMGIVIGGFFLFVVPGVIFSLGLGPVFLIIIE